MKPMKKVTILLPTHYNDGSVVEEYKLENALNRIAAIAGGYTLDGIVCGAWRNPADGVIKKETMQKVWVVCEPDCQVSEFCDLADDFVSYFNQQCIYLEILDTTVIFCEG